ncbi:MAG: ABC transporter ATP-binding protein [Rickettsiaceae bacterium]
MIGILCTGGYWGIFMSLVPYLLKQIIDRIVEFSGDKSQIFESVLPWFVCFISAWLLAIISFRFLDWFQLILAPAVRKDVVKKMYSYLNHHSYNYFQNNFAGSLSNKIGDMATGIVSIITILEEIFSQSMGLLVAFPVMFMVSPVFALILFIWLVTFVFISGYFAKRVENLSCIFAQSKTSLIGKIVDGITNISNIRLFARNCYEENNIQKYINDTIAKDRAMQWYIIKMRVSWDISIILFISSILYALISMYSKGKVTIGDFTLIIYLSIEIFHNLWHLTNQYIKFSEEMGKCNQALTIITAHQEITDAQDAKPLIVKSGKIEFSNVTFHYNKGSSIFQNKNIIIEPSQKIGLVGFSGSGKTTFVNLILRLFDIESGVIKIDDQDISKVTQESLRSNISIIPQDISLFHRPLIENLRYGNIVATDQEVIDASKKSHCHDFIMNLPNGYDTFVGERGVKLSGGQRQRITIARAMLKNAPILILDEATSALDSVTEKYIQESIDNLMKNRTTIVIAHRLSTLAEMDKILVFDCGRVIESGSHEQLLSKDNGHYAQMWRMQAGGFLPDVKI